MPGSGKSSRPRSGARALTLLGLMLLSADASAEKAQVSARLLCQRETSPGRVRCELELETQRGRLVWGDALVVAAPAHAPPLRARIGPQMASDHTERRLRLPVSLVATRQGSGKLVVRGRAVVCSEPPRAAHCRTATAQAEAVVEVGEPGREPG